MWLLLILMGSATPHWCSITAASDPTAVRSRMKSAQLTQSSAVSAPPDWTQGLKIGPNGPIPLIVVDQFGYPSTATKIAVIRSPKIGYDSSSDFTPGSRYALIEQTTQKVVKAGAPLKWNGGELDPASGDRAWWFDFSEITTPGTYAIVDLERNIRSSPFAIGEDVYRQTMKHAGRMFYYQRAGLPKTRDFASAAWVDAASHLNAGQDAQSRPWPGAADILSRQGHAQVKDLQGGWYDAGDYNKYTSWTARNIVILLQAFETNPQAFGDDWGIPESGNGVPDILDEIKWGLEWLRRMQNADGSVLCVQGLASASPPSAAKGPSHFGPATTSATLMTTAAFAYAAKVFAKRPEPAHQAFAADLSKRALAAWAWATANPSVVYFNNDNGKQAGSGGLAAGQQEMSDSDRHAAKFEAAVHLNAINPTPALKSFIEANASTLVPAYGPSQWDSEKQEIVLRYAQHEGVPEQVRSELRERFLKNMANTPSLAEPDRASAYRAFLKDVTWGSNKSIAAMSRLLYQTSQLSPNTGLQSKAKAAALDYVHYIHGINPLGLVYLTNMTTAGARHSANTMFHAWFAAGTRWERTAGATPGPPPGYLVGGPNPSYALDQCCRAPATALGFKCGGPAADAMCKQTYTPPLGQPPLKSYFQFGTGWPANSWEITEPSTLYQATYIRALAPFVQ